MSQQWVMLETVATNTAAIPARLKVRSSLLITTLSTVMPRTQARGLIRVISRPTEGVPSLFGLPAGTPHTHRLECTYEAKRALDLITTGHTRQEVRFM